MFIKVLKQSRKRLFLVILIYLVFVAVWFGAREINNKMLDQHDTQTGQLLENISLTENDAEDEISELETYISSHKLSDSSLGHTYKTLAELYYMTGDDKKYNEKISKASYYLEKAGDDNSLAELYTHYMGKLYANGAYESCQYLFDELKDKIDISSCEPKVQIDYYLGIADAQGMLGDNEQARKNIKAAQNLLNTDIDYTEKGIDAAKADILQIRMLINDSDFESAKKVLAKYHEDDTFGVSNDNMFLICDYTIPYYEMKAKLLIDEQKYEEANEYIKLYIQYCDRYNFRRMKLNLLDYVDIVSHEDDAFIADEITSIEKELTTQTLNESSEQYGEHLLMDINDRYEDMNDEEREYNHRRTNIFEIVTILFALFLITTFVNRVFIEMRIDGLTRLRNRKAYEEDRERLYKKKESYYLMIMDIDDFKKINDAFAHQIGDEVLVGISDILLKVVK